MRILAFLIDLIDMLLGFPVSINEDSVNRNDRGKFQPVSERSVTR
jgi:hypothetical protein